MSQTTALTIRLSPADNVVVARAALRAETRIEEEDLTTVEAIDPGHKVATQPIKKGDTVRKYDQIIGIAKSDIRPGQHVHTHNLRMDDFDRDYKFSESVRELDFVKPDIAATFQGIVRSDGRVGTHESPAAINLPPGAVTFGELLRVLERCAGGPVTEDELDNLIEVILYNSIDSGDGESLRLV